MAERTEKLEALYDAVLACLDRDNAENQRALASPETTICASIPVRLWNMVKAAAEELGSHEDIFGE
jgi:hypothetical protein